MIDATRRDFLRWGSSAMAMGALSPLMGEGISRVHGGNRFPAVAAYSFRNHFGFMKGKANKRLVEGSKKIDMIEFIRLCAGYGVGAELTSYFFPPDADAAYFTNCRRECHVNGVPVVGTAVGNQFTVDPGSSKATEQMDYVKAWIDRAVLMGAPHVRVFAGSIPKGMEESEAEQNAVEALKRAGDYAANKGIFLGVENHDSIGSAEKLLAMVSAVDNPWVAINLDSGNFRTEDPYRDFAECVPLAVNVQLKTEIRIGGEKVAADFDRLFGALEEGQYCGHVVLEYEEEGNPFEAVPELLGKIRSHLK